MFRFTIRDVLWLLVVVAMGVVWWYHAWGLWIGKAKTEQEMRDSGEEIVRLRAELAAVNPDKVNP